MAPNAIVVSNWTVSISNDLDLLICRGSTNDTSPHNPQQGRAGIACNIVHIVRVYYVYSQYVKHVSYEGKTFLAFGIVIIVFIIIAMILIGTILGLALKRRRKLHIQSPTDSSNIYSRTNNYVQQRYH